MFDTAYNWLGFLFLAVVTLAAATAVGARGRSPWPPRLLLFAVVLRIVGSFIRYEVLFGYYNGVGDAGRYFLAARPIADKLRDFSLSPFSIDFWFGESRWWGTSFLERFSAVVIAGVGPTLRGAFLVFALLSFAGLVLLAWAFWQVQPERSVVYAAWIWLWPSMWFWPSSMGKEALIVLAIGLVAYGYVGNGTRIRWPALLLGVAIAFCVRPHIAAALAAAVLAARWLASWERASPRRVLEAAIAAALFIGALSGMTSQLGIEQPDLEGVREFVAVHQVQSAGGGSRIEGVSMSIAGVPLAFVNVWLRPFPWEAHNITSLVASLEIVAFWGLVWVRRRETMLALKHWRRHRLLTFALPLLISYTLMIGIAFGNLGLIARQRAPIFAFMLVFALAVPALERAPGRSARVALRDSRDGNATVSG